MLPVKKASIGVHNLTLKESRLEVIRNGELLGKKNTSRSPAPQVDAWRHQRLSKREGSKQPGRILVGLNGILDFFILVFPLHMLLSKRVTSSKQFSVLLFGLLNAKKDDKYL